MGVNTGSPLNQHAVLSGTEKGGMAECGYPGVAKHAKTLERGDPGRKQLCALGTTPAKIPQTQGTHCHPTEMPPVGKDCAANKSSKSHTTAAHEIQARSAKH